MNVLATHRRRGSIYVLVLGCAMIVTVIGLSALTLIRVERRFAENTGDFAQARFYAKSAIEMGLLRIHQNANWRTTYTSGTWEANRPIGTGNYTLEGIDPEDGNLGNDRADPLILIGTGVQGSTRYKLQVTLAAEVRPLTCLEVACHAGNDMVFEASAILNSDKVISANDTVSASGSVQVYSDVEAVNTITGETYYQNTTTGIKPRTMPDPATVFDFYVSNGTAISINALPSQAGKRCLRDVVLSPASNPYGLTNAQGIYVIDCMSQVLQIDNCRIVGTLVLLQPGSGSSAYSYLHWEPAVSHYPALLVQGSFEISIIGTSQLDEALRGVNFNPVGTPYLGQEDDLSDDKYPDVLRGLVYASNDLTTLQSSRIEGVVVSGNTITHKSFLDLIHQSIFFSNPPPGFEFVQMVISPGTWRQVVD